MYAGRASEIGQSIANCVSAGVSIAFRWDTMGHYDGLFISELPDDATAAKFILAVGSSGFMSTETLKAFSEEEFRLMLGSLG